LISGRICGIDEKTAIFWMTCKRCESKSVTKTQSGYEFLYIPKSFKAFFFY